ncbi:hypothetical protein D3C71_923130 [compost metagenome]
MPALPTPGAACAASAARGGAQLCQWRSRLCEVSGAVGREGRRQETEPPQLRPAHAAPGLRLRLLRQGRALARLCGHAQRLPATAARSRRHRLQDAPRPVRAVRTQRGRHPCQLHPPADQGGREGRQHMDRLQHRRVDEGRAHPLRKRSRKADAGVRRGQACQHTRRAGAHLRTHGADAARSRRRIRSRPDRTHQPSDLPGHRGLHREEAEPDLGRRHPADRGAHRQGAGDRQLRDRVRDGQRRQEDLRRGPDRRRRHRAGAQCQPVVFRRRPQQLLRDLGAAPHHLAFHPGSEGLDGTERPAVPRGAGGGEQEARRTDRDLPFPGRPGGADRHGHHHPRPARGGRRPPDVGPARKQLRRSQAQELPGQVR